MVVFSELNGKQKMIYIFCVALILAIVGPIFGLAALAAKNIFMFGVWAIAAAGLAFFWPTISRMMKTWSLKIAKGNARANPIETLELDYTKKREALNRFVDFVKSMIAAHRVSQEELNALKDRFQDRDLSDRQDMMDKMKAAVDILRTKAEGAERQLTSYGSEIEFIKADNAWARRATGAMTQMKTIDGVDVLDEILKGEAIGQVRQNVAEAFAELDMLLDQEDTKHALGFRENDTQIIEGVSVRVPHMIEQS